jgi:hypothetical protein
VLFKERQVYTGKATQRVGPGRPLASDENFCSFHVFGFLIGEVGELLWTYYSSMAGRENHRNLFF